MKRIKQTKEQSCNLLVGKHPFASQLLAVVMIVVMNLVGMPAFSQTRTVTGHVTAEGEPVIGVTVLVKGTNTGTVTDLDGNYSLQAP